MLNMFDMWNTVSTKLEAQSNIQQSQQPHTSGGSIKGNFDLIQGTTALGFGSSGTRMAPPDSPHEMVNVIGITISLLIPVIINFINIYLILMFYSLLDITLRLR